MNLAQFYIGQKETVEYYQIRPRHITAASNPNCSKWIVFARLDDIHCGMTPEKFVKIVTDNGAIRHILDNANVPIFYEYEECIKACRLLHIYLYRRDYIT